ncbi:acyltransferase family protein [Pontibacter litorisediminis]|uniref:acyltransferase family protein n=1 Tax=Pontibacter litorisediminis TaxID=1846260 RepID=UPI0023EDD093|nr:acyltransferase [Pontibacter litorisediminis]
MKQHLQQIDVVKGLAIVAVLLLHSLTRAELEKSYAIYHIWQAVPLFLVVMGLNLGLSTRHKTQHLQQLYTRKYFTKKAARIFVPFILIFLLSILAGLLWEWLKGEKVLEFSGYTWIGVLPVTGPGNYFITMLLQSVLLLPIIGYGFSRRPILTTSLLVLLEVAFQVWAAHFSYFNDNPYLYDAAFARYFSALAFGLWLSRLVWAPVRWWHILSFTVLGAMAAAALYLLLYGAVDMKQVIRPEWKTQQLLTFGYAALLVWLCVNFLPNFSNFIPLRVLAELGKASYHIFLVQVVYFGLTYQDLPHLANIFIPTLIGYLFYKYESVLLFGS